MKKINLILLVSCILLFFNNLIAQDTIVKINGERIIAKIIQIDTSIVTYKKSSIEESPLFIEKQENISMIKFSNGEIQVFEHLATKPQISIAEKIDIVGNVNLQYGPGNQYQITHIEGKKYSINQERVKLKDVNNLLARSTNPLVQVAQKKAYAIRIVEKLFTYTSIATTSAGSVTSIATIVNVSKSVRNGSIRPGDYWGMALSLFGTMAFPITSKILKNREAKLYDKAIDLYNVKN